MIACSLATACGLWGLAGSLTWSYARTRRAMLAVLVCTQPGYILHWALKGDWTAAGLSVLSLLLTLLSTGLSGPVGSLRVTWTRRAFVLALVPVAVIAAATWNGLPSLFAAVGMALGCYARWQTESVRFRRLMLATSLPWLAHDLLAQSAAAVCADLFGITRGAWVEARGFRLRATSRAASPAHAAA